MAGQTQSLDEFKVKFEPEIWTEWAIPFANSLGGWLNEITKLSLYVPMLRASGSPK